MGENEDLVRRMLLALVNLVEHAEFHGTPAQFGQPVRTARDAIAAAEAALSPQVAPDLPMPPYPFQPLDETGGTNLRGRT